MNYLEIVNRLIGKIEPIGETNVDNIRLENIKNMIELMKDLHIQIDNIAYYNKDRHEHSMKEIGKLANDYLDWLGIKE